MTNENEISEEERVIIWDFINGKHILLSCPICHTGNMELELRYYAAAGYERRKDYNPAALLTCDNCAYMIKFKKSMIIGE